jgi:hypothetical protein
MASASQNSGAKAPIPSFSRTLVIKKGTAMRLLFSLMILLSSLYSTDMIKEQEYPKEKMREQNRKILKMVVDEISKKLPQKIDNYTNMINIRDENLTLIYTFEINTGIKSDESVRKEDKGRMQKVVTKGICTSSKRFLEVGVALVYEYKSAISKEELFSFRITKKRCEEEK